MDGPTFVGLLIGRFMVVLCLLALVEHILFGGGDR